MVNATTVAAQVAHEKVDLAAVVVAVAAVVAPVVAVVAAADFPAETPRTSQDFYAFVRL